MDGCARRSTRDQGEPRLPATQPHGRKWTTSGFNVSISEAGWDDLAGQVVDAQAFLARYRGELQRLRTYPGVDGVELDFPLELRIGSEDVVVQSDRFPPELLLAAGELGIAIAFTIYPPPDEEAGVSNREDG